MIECCRIYAGRAGVCSEPGRLLADPTVALYMMREENTRDIQHHLNEERARSERKQILKRD